MKAGADEWGGMQSYETFLCVTVGRVCERELGKVW